MAQKFREIFTTTNNKLFIVITILVLLSWGGYTVIEKYTKVFFAAHSVQVEESTELSQDEYLTVKSELLALTDENDPRFALTEVRERIKTDNALLRSCHVLVHEIGHAAYEKYKDFGEAIKYKDEVCNSGYLHGVIEAHFSESKDVFTDMRNICEPYPLGKFVSWECYHGIGHGVMYYTLNDLPKSLELCEGYPDFFASNSCISGVFMENFNSDQDLHKSKFLNEADPFYPCPNQADRHKRDCYIYSPVYYLNIHKNDYADALAWCLDAEKGYENICARGLGTQAIKENINNPNLVEIVCGNGESSQNVPCISGLVSLYINHYGSLEPAKGLCKSLKFFNRQTCREEIEKNSTLF
ncbi:MAG: hypothetical protein A3J48_01090 [Candidatus Doudnabacteria bacterium RIFCSPHIGHO2_02_FULL_46_11]|uniref:Uncharacterized protein n=1 Tax=Candidatus Doudnabacteria bacterium RIFCSPHIGHO2_02_FULL_46_11 TaxID=1817832 RepID=A0A1F5P8R2_9BACT|nr:MAG: hypothetical protein A3J48_01090 [Candidatus Doudnabacteria bacterium RIFCSPHIGHO2_02_FULL_46_11]